MIQSICGARRRNEEKAGGRWGEQSIGPYKDACIDVHGVVVYAVLSHARCRHRRQECSRLRALERDVEVCRRQHERNMSVGEAYPTRAVPRMLIASV